MNLRFLNSIRRDGNKSGQFFVAKIGPPFARFILVGHASVAFKLNNALVSWPRCWRRRQRWILESLFIH